MAGTIVYFSKRGYGFAAADEEKKGGQCKPDFFVHVSHIFNGRELRVGQRISFLIGEPTLEHPNRAVQVELLDGRSAVKS
jgi:cold shock CspA family protein